MIDATRVCRSLFVVILLAAVTQIQPSLHGHNNAFVQDDSDVQYFMDGVPFSMHKDFADAVHGTGDNLNEANPQDAVPHIEFQPRILDFKERQLGIPHQETVTLFNRDDNRTIHLSSISGNTQHFHSSFFQDKVIPPLGNTTISVVFLGREEGEIDSHLFIHTSQGTLKYQVKGVSVSSPYRLRPVVGVKLPINASFNPLIYMHNPHSDPMQIVEVYSSGREFQLELPSGEVEGPRELWEIPPYQTKPVIRLHFNAYTEKNHTAYIRFRVNNSAELLIVAVEVEVSSGAGLHWAENSGLINFGIGGTYQPATRYQIKLKNSGKKPVKVQNIISTPSSKALKIDFEPTVIPGDTETPFAVGTLTYDWKAGLDLKHLKGKLLIKGVGPGGSHQKLSIPWRAEVLEGGLEVNTSATHYCSPHSSHPRNFSVVNKFKLPLAITDVSLPPEAASFFSISNFTPKILKSGERDNIFTLSLVQNAEQENMQLESSILIRSNVSTVEVPLLSYNGKLKVIIPNGREGDGGSMNFGTVSSDTDYEGILALENQNPVDIELLGWGVNMRAAVLELMGCQNDPTAFLDRGSQNITSCSLSDHQSIKPGHLAIFKIKIKTTFFSRDALDGDIFIKTNYERLIVPVHMRVEHGKFSIEELILTDCFPGSTCSQHMNVRSTFPRPMEVTSLTPMHKDERVKYIPLEESSSSTISRGNNHIGSIVIDPSISCKESCYLGLSLNTSIGNQWLNTLNLPSHTWDFDLNLLNTHYTRYLNASSNSWNNITMQLDTTGVRGFKFSISMKPSWPSLVTGRNDSKVEDLLSFPLTQVGNTSSKTVSLHNPTRHPLAIHLVMDWSYPQGTRLLNALPNRLKPSCTECPDTVHGEFRLSDLSNEKDFFDQGWGPGIAPHSLAFVLKPNTTKVVELSYTPSSTASSSAVLYIRNNMTILEVVRLVGRGAHAKFKFGNRKPGSESPLIFELTEKHLKDCQSQESSVAVIPNLTVKRSFVARNTGELPINVYEFFINGLPCEGYGFKVLECVPFTLSPNATKKIEIAFTPDFTMSRVERNLFILTSLGLGLDSELEHENGMVKLNLVTTMPAHMLEVCARMISRPSWENALQWVATGVTVVLLVFVLAAALLEADRILLVNMSRGNPTQPPLDLRLLLHSSSLTSGIHNRHHNNHNHHHSKERLLSGGDDVNRTTSKAGKKGDASPDWSLMNVKRNKEKDGHKGMKIPDWSPEEERRFRLDTESKATPTLRRSAGTDSGSLETGSNSGTKKRSNKRHGTQDSETASPPFNSDMQLLHKKNSTSTKSSPVHNRKVKSGKDEPAAMKLVEVEVEKRKQTNASVNSGVPHRKYDISASQKSTQYFEEETSSTTTESSTQEDNNAYKECESHCDKSDKAQKKSNTKKPKSQTTLVVPSVDFKDNYEGDCDDDDDYDKEKTDDPNRWKTNTARSGGKNQILRPVTESSNKFSRPKQTPAKKEKIAQKRRSVEKILPKVPVSGIAATPPKEEAKPQTISPQTISSQTVSPQTVATSSSVPPPPVACWGENRAKFSDVVARNQDIFSSYMNPGSNQILRSTPFTVPETFGISNSECTKRQPIQDLMSSTDCKFESNPTSLSNKKGILPSRSDILGIQSRSHLNTYFANNFHEPLYEPELVPYDDLPETTEPLTELENTEDSSCSSWLDTNTYVLDDLITSGTPLQTNLSASTENKLSLSGSLKDNWASVDNNWEPLYTRGAVGEERSGVWGINTGGVWAASPWGAPTPPSSLPPISLSQPNESNVQESTGFDPFRSLNTIWTPSSSDNWTSKQND
ncbi:hypothetical protein QAD02_012431 [Eretmocerus hayati]|uniref:Uncharacterized protein n=1 Tax=Eretmocerus hayati TaxID=131215 RepID=A0ACC2NZH1_9HYME|nr:hypothetical protein QAD02_012431 [Eretmocerus hayati]